ncbi:hypothetical protein ACFOY8_14640 [Thalassospira xianhensis]|uniref:Uncharacterized protein n=1 Tax=Thalassospira xianhensis MCCC 1A02616 TaxID=1177929 RepID=A0A367UJV8_9PROT|nr:hypothetical protein [Thalassospira xianhensis]RCK07614.1 hypothetical protein TH5_00600 [Thalassospira xianhensis MCCC 1A02616]
MTIGLIALAMFILLFWVTSPGVKDKAWIDDISRPLLESVAVTQDPKLDALARSFIDCVREQRLRIQCAKAVGNHAKSSGEFDVYQKLATLIDKETKLRDARLLEQRRKRREAANPMIMQLLLTL